MAKLISALLFSLVTFSAVSALTSLEFSKLFRTSSTSSFTTMSTSCREVLNSTSGTITYKTNETLVPNERCVWTIRAPNATSYSFGIFEMGFSEPSNGFQITVAGVARNSELVQLVPTQPGIYNVENVNVLVVTLHAGPSPNANNSTGFSLQYIGTSSPGTLPPVSTKSSDIITTLRLISEYGRLDYPEGIRYFDNNELSTFVFTSYGNAWNKSEEEGMLYRAQLGDRNCGDFTDLYYFNADTTPATWEFQTQLCYNDDGRFFMIPHKDMVLAVFQTNEVDTYFGLAFIRPDCI